jgi:c-di-GMP-binding flagellar brake protein YcgR
MALTEIETRVLKSCCELNDVLTLNVRENEKLFVYKSRFLEVNFNRGFIIIDVPSPETPDGKPLSKGQSFEVFFEYKVFRYLFDSKILDHTQFKLNDRSFYALKMRLPQQLKDGDKRDYFRVETPMRPPLPVRFNIYAGGAGTPIMSMLMQNKAEEFQGEMVDISGGGIAVRGKPGDKNLPLEKGDVINARFKLKPGLELMEIWCEVRNTRKYKDTEILVWGFRFLGKERNKTINYYRNKILRYVTERQREILAK